MRRAHGGDRGTHGAVPPKDADDQHLRWYWVAATYKSIDVGVQRKRHLWERTVFLVRAVSDAEAACAAERVARSKELEYVAAAGNRVRWTLQEVERVQELFDRCPEEGTEVYWEFF